MNTAMTTASLIIDLAALAANWKALDAKTGVETAAVVKANGYGLGSGPVAQTLAKAGARTFFVAVAEEGVAVRDALGDGPEICVFSGHMDGDAQVIAGANLIPMINSPEQLVRHRAALPDHRYGIQLDSGMNRLGMEADDWAAVRADVLTDTPRLIMSHLACADEPEHPMNAQQLQAFRDMTDGVDVPRSLSATGGILLGTDYHFDLCRPGIGLYGGEPFVDAQPVVTVDLPVIQVRDVHPGETVGYGNTWTAEAPARIATVAAGYADGIIRAMGPRTALFAGDVACPIRGRISMDLIGVDVSALNNVPDHLQLLNAHQGVDTLAAAAGTIGYEILTSLGARYQRRYLT